ncbi:MAG TPA: hypothetical protein VNV16_04765, partial [Methylibium sp.]|nr:hypothetical protein [Methylibium sp.]
MRSRSAAGTPGPRSHTASSTPPELRLRRVAAVAARVLEQVAQRAADAPVVAEPAGQQHLLDQRIERNIRELDALVEEVLLASRLDARAADAPVVAEPV